MLESALSFFSFALAMILVLTGLARDGVYSVVFEHVVDSDPVVSCGLCYGFGFTHSVECGYEAVDSCGRVIEG